MDFQENVFIKVSKIPVSGAGFAGARNVYLYYFYKDISWKSKTTNEVKHDVELKKMLMWSIYVRVRGFPGRDICSLPGMGSGLGSRRKCC